MSHFFDVYGPYEIDRSEGQIYRAGQSMWEEIKTEDDGLRKAWGCYVFCLQNGASIVPWYVGMTVAEGGFQSEAFADLKLDLYNGIASNRGRRMMLLLPFMTGDHHDAGRFSWNKGRAVPVIQWLERILIGMALQQNPDLLNVVDASLPRSVTVRGVLGERRRGRQYSSVGFARAALGLAATS